MLGSFVKPSVCETIEKITKLLKKVDADFKIEQWSFYDTPREIPNQTNDYACGVVTCVYARCLANVNPMIVPTIPSISDVRRYLILKLHKDQMLPVLCYSMTVKVYYTVDYVTHYYCGRGLHNQGEFIRLKFLQKKTVFNILNNELIKPTVRLF